MKFVQKEFSWSTEEKKSKFLSFLIPYEDFLKILKRLKQEHPKAVHYVYAYRYLNEFNQIVENSSDDGEPKGTSGKPCLNALKGADIINSAVIVVRYFGGTLLGTGGLVRAYSGATNGVIEVSEFFEYVKKEKKIVSCEYSIFSKLEYLVEQYDIKVIEKKFDLNCELLLESTNEVFIEFNKKLPLGAIIKTI